MARSSLLSLRVQYTTSFHSIKRHHLFCVRVVNKKGGRFGQVLVSNAVHPSVLFRWPSLVLWLKSWHNEG